MTLKMRGFDKLEKKKFCVKAYWRKTVIPALVQICVTVFISKQNIASRLWDWVEICRCCKFDKISEVFESIMPDSKCGPFNKEEQLFIIEEFARSPKKPRKCGIKLMITSDAYCVSKEWRNFNLMVEYQIPAYREPDKLISLSKNIAFLCEI